MILKCFFAFLVSSLVAARRIPVPQERIVGGYHTFIEVAPYQVAVLIYGVQTCGGAIYSERIVLTAAHCINGINAKHFSVRAGSSFPNFGGQVVAVQKAHLHEKFDPIYLINDIAVLYLKAPLKLNTPRARRIELAKEMPKPGEKCMVTGWGYTYFGSNLGAPTLLATDLTIANYNLCRAKYFGFKITENMICAEAPGTGTCDGDSGGPLVSLQSHKLIGIVTGGRKCASEGHPGIYVNVAYFRNWTLKAIDIVKKNNKSFD